MTVFDTSVLVALVDHDHAHHDAAVATFEGAEQAILPIAVAQEFTEFVRRRAKQAGRPGNQPARAALRALLDQPRVRLVTAMDVQLLLTVFEANPALSFADSVVAACTLESGMPLATLDADLAKVVRSLKRKKGPPASA